MKALIAAITSVKGEEAIKMFSNGVMLAISVFTASKAGTRSKGR